MPRGAILEEGAGVYVGVYIGEPCGRRLYKAEVLRNEDSLGRGGEVNGERSKLLASRAAEQVDGQDLVRLG